MRKIIKQESGGYIALLAVLIIGAAAIASALALLTTGTDSQRTALVRVQSTHALKAAEACGEEALQVMHDNTAFTGSAGLTIGQASCTYTVTNLGGTSRRVDVSSSENGVARKMQIYATISSSSISITSWQDVS